MTVAQLRLLVRLQTAASAPDRERMLSVVLDNIQLVVVDRAVELDIDLKKKNVYYYFAIAEEK